MFANFSFPAMAKTKLEPAAGVHAPPKSLLLLLLLQVASCKLLVAGVSVCCWQMRVRR